MKNIKILKFSWKENFGICLTEIVTITPLQIKRECLAKFLPKMKANIWLLMLMSLKYSCYNNVLAMLNISGLASSTDY